MGGYGWKTRFARFAGLNYATVKRYAAGHRAPGPVMALIDQMEQVAALSERLEAVTRERDEAVEALAKARRRKPRATRPPPPSRRPSTADRHPPA